MSPAEIVAQAYAVPVADIERLPDGIVTILWRNAVHRGWLVAEDAA